MSTLFPSVIEKSQLSISLYFFIAVGSEEIWEERVLYNKIGSYLYKSFSLQDVMKSVQIYVVFVSEWGHESIRF